MLLGGIRCGFVTDFFGESGVGKTQLCFQLSIAVASKIEESGLDSKVMYVDPLRTFRPERIKEIAEARGLNANHIFSNIYVFEPRSYEEQMSAITGLHRMDSKLRLLIIDGLVDCFGGSEGTEESVLFQSQLGNHLHTLRLEAMSCGIAIVVTNAVRSRLRGPSTLVEVGGNVMSQGSHFIVYLFRTGERFAAMLRHPTLSLREGHYKITSRGCEDTI